MSGSFNTITEFVARSGIERVHEIVLADSGNGVCVAVVNERRILTSFENIGDCKEAVADLAIAKAKTAIYLQKNTITLHRAKVDPANYPDFRVTCFGGGVLVIRNQEIIGAVGVSGRKAGSQFLRLVGEEGGFLSKAELDMLSGEDCVERNSDRIQDHELALECAKAIVLHLNTLDQEIEESLSE